MAISTLIDKRVDCLSILTEIRADKYLELIEAAYEDRGGLSHQRSALKTASGRRIRERMVRDIIGGAVLPPLVIGAVAKAKTIDSLSVATEDELFSFLRSEHHDGLAIIDGMQRTTALREAIESDSNVRQQTLRLELWLANQVESLIYRMLILNSGQVPWNLKQQLRVLYEPLVKELEEQVDFSRLLTPSERRWKGGEFSSDDMIEAYIAFGLRRTEVDTQENLAEEFSRLDISDALTSNSYNEIYFPIVQMMVDLDRVFSRYDPLLTEPKTVSSRKLKRVYDRGKNIFDTQPPRIGFIVSNAVQIIGRIGMDKERADSLGRLAGLRELHTHFVQRLEVLNEEQLAQFLALEVLEEALSARPTSAVGRWERAFWEAAFRVLLEENYEVPSMEPCWRAG